MPKLKKTDKVENALSVFFYFLHILLAICAFVG